MSNKFIHILFSIMIFAITLSGQTITPTGTITVPSNTIIANGCSFSICATFNRGSQKTEVFFATKRDSVSLTSYGHKYLISNNYVESIVSSPSTYSNTSVTSACLQGFYTDSIAPPGIYKFYLLSFLDSLIYGTAVDSIELNIVNPIISGYTYSITAIPIVSATHGEQEITISPLNPLISYTINLGICKSNYTSLCQTMSPSNVSGVSSITYTFTPPDYNYAYYYGMGIMYSNCINSGSTATISVAPFAVTTSTCSSYIILSSPYSPYYPVTYTLCVNDTINELNFNNLLSIQSNSLSANEVITVYVNFGDGQGIKTYTVSADANGAFNGNYYNPLINNLVQVYTSPGAYSVKVWASSQSACHVDTSQFTINVPNISCSQIMGNVFYDANNDCLKSTGEVGVNGAKIVLIQGTTFISQAWVDVNGNYSFYNVPAGAYTISLASNLASLGYSVSCVSSLSHSINVVISNSITVNFPLSCGLPNMLVRSITSFSPFFPGQTSSVQVNFNLTNVVCSNPFTGNRKIILPACLQYVSSYYPPDNIISCISGDTLVWNNINTSYINFYVTTCSSAQIGDTVCMTTIITTYPNDSNPLDNAYTRCTKIGNSFDPNGKEVYPEGTGTQGYIPANTPELLYTIHFQNTGTASAHNIYLLDTISQYLDFSSLEIINSSHTMQPYWLLNNVIKFMFANIMLSDSTSNKAQSYGYVTYKIKPKTNLLYHTEIKNTANIYFDYNPPIVTNTTLNTIEMITVDLQKINNTSSIVLYPNPASTDILVRVTSTEKTEGLLSITDISGREVFVKAIALQAGENTLHQQTSQLQNGIYFVQLKTTNVLVTKKLVIAK